MYEIRNVEATDIEGLKAVLDSINLFPSSMLEDMIFDYLNNPGSEDIWFTAVQNGVPVSIAYCAPERLTEGTYNLYAIGVKEAAQNGGVGGQMMAYIEQLLRQKGHRVLIVETSGTAAYLPARSFYEKLKYTKEAVIRDFWSEGDDKVVFWKKLN